MEEEQEQLRMKMTELFSTHIECPVCYSLPTGKIFMCNFGHNSCVTCFLRLKRCPICRAEMKSPTRNISLEEISKQLFHSCSNPGCEKQRIMISEMKDHIHSCSFERIRCPYESCNFFAKKSEIKDHTKQCIYEPIECLKNRCVWKGPYTSLSSHMLYHRNEENIHIITPTATQLSSNEHFVLKVPFGLMDDDVWFVDSFFLIQYPNDLFLLTFFHKYEDEPEEYITEEVKLVLNVYNYTNKNKHEACFTIKASNNINCDLILNKTVNYRYSLVGEDVIETPMLSCMQNSGFLIDDKLEMHVLINELV
jgi:hypothetical protein